ncbi:hypothetical protein GGS23DRAFT_592792 [Durotheca rogersii]|uniref:uncharacterized protein n=1 Tax=Durotheca rogersii TaxID=419775 RepID=UPI0022209429|nr:uncharacterized protein GGS23DRAFT_592792 [Durotheca rogersii]KAI5867481.1 hypothetical protein GGS23DRAFT_592792 [Durotheca rogersii]
MLLIAFIPFLVLPLLSFADLPNSKGSVSPPLDFRGVVEEALQASLNATPRASLNQWKRMVEESSLDPSDFHVLQVGYKDCAQSWVVMCRHSGANTSVDTLVSFSHQFATFQAHYREVIAPNLKPNCTRRLLDSPIAHMARGATAPS